MSAPTPAEEGDRLSSSPSYRESDDKVGLWAVILGVSCVGILPALLLGLSSLNRARKEDRKPSAMAIAALLLVAGWVLTSAVLFVILLPVLGEVLRDLDAMAAGGAPEHDLAEARAGQLIDAKTACRLIEERLRKDGFLGEKGQDLADVQCIGPYESRERTAVARAVKAPFVEREFVLNGCLARHTRWFVLEMTVRECTDVEPERLEPPPGTDPDESQLEAHETRLRARHRERVAGERLKTLDQQLSAIRRIAQVVEEGTPTRCDESVLSRLIKDKANRSVLTLDADLDPKPKASPDVDAGAGAQEPFEWLTSQRIQTLLRSSSASARRNSAHELGELIGPVVVAFSSSSRRWPRIGERAGGRFLFEPGSFRGWLVVFELQTAKPLCQTELAFESSERVNAELLGLSAQDGKSKAMLGTDLEFNFRARATQALARIAPTLDLGYTLTD